MSVAIRGNVRFDTLDSDAGAYIDAVAASVPVSLIQRQAINKFVKEEKTAGRWTSLKRLYLPVWGNATANARCMVSGTSGSFVGGVTHGSGFVQGNGTSGYFRQNILMSSIGLATSNLAAGVLCNIAPSSLNMCYFSGADSGAGFNIESNNYQGIGISNGSIMSAIFNTPLANRKGIFMTSRISSTDHYGLWRTSSTLQTATGNTSPATGILNAYYAAMTFQYQTSTPSTYSDAGLGAYFIGLGMSLENSQAFTLNLKTLWESCTGLTLP